MPEETEDVCKLAHEAADNVIVEKCGGRVLIIGEYGRVFVPGHVLKSCGANPGVDGEEREEAIKRCMAASWARGWADAVVGANAPLEIKDRAARRLCEGLFT